MRHLALALIATVVIAGCVRKDYAFVYHQEGLSDAKLLEQQIELRNTPGVQHVFTNRTAAGHCTIDVGVKEGYDALIQQKLAEMGWIRGEH